MYRYGANIGYYGLSYAMTMVVTSEIFLPVFYRLAITSTYEVSVLFFRLTFWVALLLTKSRNIANIWFTCKVSKCRLSLKPILVVVRGWIKGRKDNTQILGVTWMDCGLVSNALLVF